MTERVFDLPDLGEGLEDAEIVQWKVAEGDTVELNQPLIDVNTAKALVEIPSPFAGRIVELHGGEGDVVKVGAPLVTFDVEGGAEEAPPKEAPKREAVLVGYGVDQEAATKRRRRLRPPGERRAPAAGRDAAPAADQSATTRAPATPPVRRLARERGVDLATVTGTGPGGRITREDVVRAAEGAEPLPSAGAGAQGGAQAAPRAPQPGTDERIPVRGVRRLVAQKMARSWAEIPHVTTMHDADATYVDALRRELSEEAGAKVSALAVVVRALVEVCRAHPLLNASWDGDADEIVLRGNCHVGIATDTERGLVVPVVRDADRKGIATVAREIAEVVSATRDGKATPDQVTGSTITVTNYGTFGSRAGTPIINHPEAAILGLGAIRPQPAVVDGRLEARPTVTLALSFDHRILDGADADRAMQDLVRLLESPFRLGALPRG
ncbi:MAG TPA: dihydrolipoamide acetyltransferase family protein [Actinomycetota bacterium]|nr:dihydrolipoamide acetyltransferase family protein [Actinomycetota bacterium]